MKHFFLYLGLWYFLALPAEAFSPVQPEISRPYEIVTLDNDLQSKQDYLGELVDYPVMYEITAADTFPLTVLVRQPYRSDSEPTPLSLIVIRKNDTGGGVTEIMRMKSSAPDWQVVKDTALGLTLWQNAKLTKEVGAGVYRIEISTPENSGRYLLTFGENGKSGGYFSTLSGIYATQKHFGYSMLHMFLSSYVYVPLGILVLVIAIYMLWRYRKSKSSAHVD